MGMAWAGSLLLLTTKKVRSIMSRECLLCYLATKPIWDNNIKYIYIYIFLCTQRNMYTSIYTHTHIHLYIHIYIIYAHTHIYKHICT